MASETPAACAISLVVVPRNPLSEKRDMATARIWRRLSSPAIRTPFMLGEVSLLTVIGLLKWLRLWKEPFPKVSTYLPSKVLRCQAKRSSRARPNLCRGVPPWASRVAEKGAYEGTPLQFRRVRTTVKFGKNKSAVRCTVPDLCAIVSCTFSQQEEIDVLGLFRQTRG